MNYRIVACDLDGTLLNHEKQISPENWLAIEEMTKQGVFFVPTTGRAYEEIPMELRESPLIRYYIASDGGTIYDKQTDTYQIFPLSRELGLEVLEKLQEYPFCLLLHADTKSYVDAATHNAAHYISFNMNQTWVDFTFTYDTPIADLLQFTREHPAIQTFIPFFRNLEDLNACKAWFEADPRLHVAQSYPYLLEIGDAAAGKGNALRRLAESLGIPMEATIAVGDSTNDSSMVTAAGLGLAMGNSVPELKLIADREVCRNTEHVADYILRNIL